MPHLSLVMGLAWALLGLGAGAAWADDDEDKNPRAFARTSPHSPDDSAGPPPGAPRAGPTYVILPAPESLDALLKRLTAPDLVVLDWARYARLLAAQKPPGPADPTTAEKPRIWSAEVSGTVGEETARLTLRIDAERQPGASEWLSIGLADQVLASVRSGSSDVAVRKLEDGGWGVRLPAEGRCPILVAFDCRVAGWGSERKLTLLTPVSPATHLDLSFPAHIREARIGEQVVALEPGAEHARCRAIVGPQASVALSWQVTAASTEPAFLVESEIELTAESGILHWREAHVVESEKGPLVRVPVDLDPAFQSYEAEVAGIVARLDLRDNGHSELVLPTKLEAGERTTITIHGIHKPESADPSKLEIHGTRFPSALRQTGWLTVRSEADTLLNCRPGRSLIQAGPKSAAQTEPGRPPHSFEIISAPFELTTSIERVRPWVWANSRNTLSIAPGSVLSDLWLDYQTQTPRPSDLRLSLPPGWTLDSIGPDTLIESTTAVGASVPATPTVIGVRLKDSSTPGNRFSLHCVARWTGATVGALRIESVRPLDAVSWLATTTVTASADLDVEPAEVDRSLVLPIGVDERAPSSARRIGAAEMIPRFSIDQGQTPEVVELRVRTNPARFRLQAEHEVFLERHAIAQLDQFTLWVEQGMLTSVELLVPAELNDRWELEGLEISHREILDSNRESTRLRLHLIKPTRDQIRLRVRSRRPFETTPDLAPRQLEARPIRLLGAASERLQTRLGCAPGLAVEPEGRGWSQSGESEAAVASPGRTQAFGWQNRAQAGETVRAFVRTVPAIRLPDVVIPRMFALASSNADGGVAVEIQALVDSSLGTLTVQLPSRAVWHGARVAGSQTLVQGIDAEGGIHIVEVPRQEAHGGELVSLNYVIPNQESSRVSWLPKFPGNVQVGDVYWEIRVARSDCVLGTPQGWDDSNQWFWGGYAFRRQPASSAAQLFNWVRSTTGSESVPSPAPAAAPSTNRAATARFLFHALGLPGQSRPWVANRILLVAMSSLCILIPSLVCLLMGWSLPALLSIATACCMIIAAAGPAALVVQLGQSGATGILLAIATAMVTRRALAQRRSALPPGPAPSGQPASGPLAPSTTLHRPVPSTDDPGGSTIIRPRAEQAAASLGSHKNSALGPSERSPSTSQQG